MDTYFGQAHSPHGSLPLGREGGAPLGRRIRNPITRFVHDERGQVLPIFAICAFFLAKLVFSSFNIGQVIEERIRLQLVADAGAYSTALWEARTFNLMAYMNRAMAANAATVGWVTTNKNLYKFITSSELQSALSIYEACMETLIAILQAIPVINATVAPVIKTYYETVYKTIYKNTLLMGIYKYVSMAIYYADGGENGALLRKGFQVINYIDQMRQAISYFGMLMVLADDSITKSIADQAGLSCSINSDYLGFATVNKIANAYRYQAITDGFPFPWFTNQAEYDYYKKVVAYNMDPVTTGFSAPPHTYFNLYPNVISAALNVALRIMSLGMCGVNADCDFMLGHGTNTELSMNQFKAKTSLGFELYLRFKIRCCWLWFICKTKMEYNWRWEIPLVSKDTETDLWPSAMYRYVNYNKWSNETLQSYLGEPKVLVQTSLNQTQLEADKLLIPFDKSERTKYSGGANLFGDLKALGAARAVYVGPVNEEEEKQCPSLWQAGWNARPMLTPGFTTCISNHKRFKDYDPILSLQALTAAGFANWSFAATELIREMMLIQ